MPSPEKLVQPAPPKRVLVVDDEPATTEFVRVLLEETGRYSVREVNEADAAPLAARQFQPELVLMDVQMPSLDGRAVACLIQNESGLERVPVLFITSKMPESDAPADNPFGWAGVLAKPFSPERLVAAVGNVFRRAEASVAAALQARRLVAHGARHH